MKVHEAQRRLTITRSPKGDPAAALLDRVGAALDRLGPVRPGDTVLAAVSGGPDSMALLSLLARIAPGKQFGLRAAHFDHGLRGVESAADSRYVAEMARRWGIPLTIGCAKDGGVVARGRGLQAAAREARYAFLERVADEIGARWVATAHTADDQAETVVMRWIRGAGLTGLAGIPGVRGRILRPFLTVSRTEIETYLTAIRVVPRRDPSNDNPRFLRTAVRRSIVPVLRALNPRVVETIGRTAGLLADDAAWFDACAEDRLSACIKGRGPGWVELARSGLAVLHPALRRRVLRRAAILAGETAELAFGVVETLAERVAAVRSSGRLVLSGRLAAELSGDRLGLFTSGVETRSPEYTHLPASGTVALPEWGFTVSLSHQPVGEESGGLDGHWNRSPHEAAFDRDRLPDMLAVRSRRPGDTFYPEGMQGRKRLQDFLVDARVPRWRRDRVPLLVAGSDLVWVVGMRRDRRYLASPSSGSAVVVRINVAHN